ncbi:DUF3558 family protein [Nocardia terpenica]|nr:DUF3558 family protein [Nocardia terpenica]NQE85562.1 DUF3558 domain-containing protein [Nocardia terpenica]
MTAVTMVGAVLVVAGCGHSGGSPTAAAPASTAPVQAEPGASVGRCGSESDADLSAVTGLAGLRLVAQNPLRCSWEADGAGDYSVVFEWFRGSPLDQRRTEVTLGPPTAVQVAGHPGIVWTGARACEIAVGSGGADFIDWKITASSANDQRPQPCSALEQLAATTLAKAE